MMTNKRNVLLETVPFMFLVARDDMSQTRRLAEEENEHVYGLWRMVLREFNMEHLIRIVQKRIIKRDVMFESNLVASRSRFAFKGYHKTFPDFIASA